MTPFEPAGLQDGPSRLGGHAVAKAVLLGSLALVWLESSLHPWLLWLSGRPERPARLEPTAPAHKPGRPNAVPAVLVVPSQTQTNTASSGGSLPRPVRTWCEGDREVLSFSTAVDDIVDSEQDGEAGQS